MGSVEQFLAVSEELYSHLLKIPNDDERTDFIEKINELLDTREVALQSLDIEQISKLSVYGKLIELDHGISKQLTTVMALVKKDIKELQQKKRHEASYTNPYAATQMIDGMYFDNKK